MSTTIRSIVRALQTPSTVEGWMAENDKEPHCLPSGHCDWYSVTRSWPSVSVRPSPSLLPDMTYLRLPRDATGDLAGETTVMRYLNRAAAVAALEHALKEVGIL